MSNFFSIYGLRELPSGRIEVSARATDPDQEGAHIVYNAPREYLWSARIGDGVRVDPVLVVFANQAPSYVFPAAEVAHPDSETFLEETADPFGALVAAASAPMEAQYTEPEVPGPERLPAWPWVKAERLDDKLTDYSFLAP